MNGKRVILLHKIVNENTTYFPHARCARRAGWEKEHTPLCGWESLSFFPLEVCSQGGVGEKTHPTLWMGIKILFPSVRGSP